MKKTLLIVLSVLLVATLFVACSSSPSSRPKEDLDYFAQHAGMFCVNKVNLDGSQHVPHDGLYYAISLYKNYGYAESYKNTTGSHKDNEKTNSDNSFIYIANEAYYVVRLNNSFTSEVKDAAVEYLNAIKNAINEGQTVDKAKMNDLYYEIVPQQYGSNIYPYYCQLTPGEVYDSQFQLNDGKDSTFVFFGEEALVASPV